MSEEQTNPPIVVKIGLNKWALPPSCAGECQAFLATIQSCGLPVSWDYAASGYRATKAEQPPMAIEYGCRVGVWEEGAEDAAEENQADE